MKKQGLRIKDFVLPVYGWSKFVVVDGKLYYHMDENGYNLMQRRDCVQAELREKRMEFCEEHPFHYAQEITAELLPFVVFEEPSVVTA